MASRLLSTAGTRLVSRTATQAARGVASVRHGHSLVVPYQHIAITNFENGIPVDQVRALRPPEVKWDFWTTSDAFSSWHPKFGGLSYVPNGDVWVMTNGKVVEKGVHWLTPFVNRMKVVKSAHPIVVGVLSTATTQGGDALDAYAVTYIKITDFHKSAFYVDPENNVQDSERAAVSVIRKTLEREVSKLGGAPSDGDKSRIAEAIKGAVNAKSSEFGLEVYAVEFRGAFPVHENVPAKLRALDPPIQLEDEPGDNLGPDYWSDVLTPPYFDRRMFGSAKEVRTPAASTLEWSIPSPPDYHHFNELPRATGGRPAEGKEVVAH